MPGSTVAPERSMTFAPAGRAPVPTLSIRLPRMTMVWLLFAEPETPSMSVPARMTVTGGGAGGSAACAMGQTNDSTSIHPRRLGMSAPPWKGMDAFVSTAAEPRHFVIGGRGHAQALPAPRPARRLRPVPQRRSPPHHRAGEARGPPRPRLRRLRRAPGADRLRADAAKHGRGLQHLP